jgi:hypothetical protein
MTSKNRGEQKQSHSLGYNAMQSVEISQKTGLFITTAVRSSDPVKQ